MACCGGVLATGAGLRAQEPPDWIFDPAAYKALGAPLTLSPRSAWLPTALAENLRTTLAWALDAERKPRVTSGVGANDFYHGHVVRNHACTTTVSAAVRTWTERRNAVYEAALDGVPFGPVRPQRLAAFTAAVREAERDAAALFGLACSDTGAACAVIYHTWESNAPYNVLPTDPRRNLRTEFAGEPRPWVLPPPPLGQPDTGVANYLYGHCHVLQFAFLIDPRGRIHATVGGARELATLAQSGAP